MVKIGSCSGAPGGGESLPWHNRHNG